MHKIENIPLQPSSIYSWGGGGGGGRGAAGIDWCITDILCEIGGPTKKPPFFRLRLLSGA